jgi:transcriptional regulator with XRE-family HTH domain
VSPFAFRVLPVDSGISRTVPEVPDSCQVSPGNPEPLRSTVAPVDPVEISRRLKAGRWLAGGVRADGKPTALTTAELAKRSPLPQNGISVNRLEEIEQLKVSNGPRPMELEKIAEALGLPAAWFETDAPSVSRGELALDQLQQALVDLGLMPDPSQGATSPSAGGKDHPGQAAEGAGG